MTGLAFGILCAAALLGLALAVSYLRRSPARPHRAAVAVLHGAAGTAGLAVLLAALRGAPPRDAMGTAQFGQIGAALLAAALVLGLAIAWAAWRQRRAPGALVGAHAGLAVAGLVVLLALVALG
jgi:hypothetical protein